MFLRDGIYSWLMSLSAYNSMNVFEDGWLCDLFDDAIIYWVDFKDYLSWKA